jgi:Spy/CpxP family protein refolding chaperone
MNRTNLLTLVSLALFTVPAVYAQGGQPPMGPQGGPGQGGPEMGFHKGGMEEDHGMRGGHGMGMGIVPPGMWWKNPDVIAKLGLTADQQKRMDEIFHQSRIQLIDLKASLEKEQLNLEPLMNANPPDQARALGEISKIADLRADLEKANAKMLLGLRGVLTADQWTKMQERHRMGRGTGPEGKGPEGQGPGGMGPNWRHGAPNAGGVPPAPSDLE